MRNRPTVSILGTNGLPAKYGGFETLVNHLVLNFSDQYDIVVYCSKTPKTKRITSFDKAKLIYFPFKANGWQSIIYDIVTIFHAFIYSRNLIILGFSGAFIFPLNFFFRSNIIFNIGGIEWQKVRGSKSSAFLEIKLKKFMEFLCVKFSTHIIIDNLYFKDYLQIEYNIDPVLAEYGGDHAIKFDIDDSLVNKYSFLNEPYDLSVSRAQEDMNIHLVLKAYESIPQRNLVVISNWNISEYGKNLYESYFKKFRNIILLNAIYDSVELNTIRSNCKIYLHTHSLCGTAPSLVEAMSLGLAVISFDVPTNRFSTENQALYFSNIQELIATLTSLNNNDLESIGKRMLKIANERYTWERVSNIYENLLIE